jgi:hypothetical protein
MMVNLVTEIAPQQHSTIHHLVPAHPLLSDLPLLLLLAADLNPCRLCQLDLKAVKVFAVTTHPAVAGRLAPVQQRRPWFGVTTQQKET